MTHQDAEQLAQALVRGDVSPAEFAARLSSAGIADVGDAQVDLDRRRRCGYPEVVFAQGKSVDALAKIIRALLDDCGEAFATRVSGEQARELLAIFPTGKHNAVGRTLRVVDQRRDVISRSEMTTGRVTIVTAGTSDLPVAEEARETALWMGCQVNLVVDVGVAGPHRLRSRLHELCEADAIVVAAGMEGALPSVVGGYVACPVIAVPTSVGYGASFGGLAALLGMLNSCAANVAVVNIDAGFKAAYLAGLIAQRRRAAGAGMSASHDPPLPKLAPRAPDSHKGTYGRVLLIGGSLGMSGAIALAGKAALRSGAGLVQLAVPAPCLATVAGFEPSYMTSPLPADEAGRIDASAQSRLIELADAATVVALGPGLGRSSGLDQLVAWLYRNLQKPLVIDADGLNALADQPDLLASHDGQRVLTPHPGEFARLINRSAGEVQADRESLASEFARRYQVVLVLKGHRSYITDGQRGAHNATGNPGMATGGTGDVLTGVLAGLLASQELDVLDAARLAAHVHGLAGDLAAAELGENSLIASDLLQWLPAAFRQVAS